MATPDPIPAPTDTHSPSTGWSLQSRHPTALQQPTQDRFLVCGLGRLGQHCVASLQQFQVKISAIDLHLPEVWHVEDLVGLLEEREPILGDCRMDAVLLKARIERCRAVLLVTQDESVNLEAAFAARKLNPRVRLVVRSGKQNLNQLLARKFGNFVAYDPSDLPATAFALAAMGESTIGTFAIDGCQLQVIQRQVKPDGLYDRFPADRMHKRSHRLLCHLPHTTATLITGEPFHRWRPHALIEAEDTIVTVERVEAHLASRSASLRSSKLKRLTAQLADGTLLRRLLRFDLFQLTHRIGDWIQQSQLRRNIVVAAGLSLGMGIATSVLLRAEAGLTWQDAISASVVLLLGGYGDVFGGLQTDQPISGWVQLLCFSTTAVSLVFILGVLSLVADTVIGSRFAFLDDRPGVPETDHVVIFGLGRVGRKVAALLLQRQQPLVAVTQNPEHEAQTPQVPVITANFLEGLAQVNLEGAKSVVMLTDDQLLNLEIGLMAQDLVQQAELDLQQDREHPLGVVIRTYDQRFSDNLAELLPEAQALCAYAISAEAFAGAAFGENILGLFRLQDQTVLVTEYSVESGDTLNSKLLSQVAYGYGVVPIFHQRAKDRRSGRRDPADHLMPSDEDRLEGGDRLVVLATIAGLKRIERGELIAPSRWQLSVRPPRNAEVLFAAAQVLHNVVGCGLQVAREFLKALPGQMELQLYDHQAYSLWRQLSGMKQLPMRLEKIKSESIVSLSR